MKITQLHPVGQGGCWVLDKPAAIAYIEDDEDNAMAVLNIRNLSDAVHKRLRIRAAQHGRSMEAEARAILTETCGEGGAEDTAETLPELIVQMYGGTPPKNIVEELILERRKEAQREK